MTRLTKKYKAACRVLGVPLNAEVPHEALYGMLVLRGFAWDGKTWANEHMKQWNRAKLRVEGPRGDVETLAQVHAEILTLSGFVVKSISRVYENRKSNNARVYIEFEYEV